MNKLHVGLIAMSLAIASASLVYGGNRVVKHNIVLKPVMAALDSSVVPLLTQETVDADVAKDSGLSMETERSCRWVYNSGDPFGVVAKSTAGGGIDSAVLTVWDWENRPVAQKRFGSGFVSNVSFTVQGRGTYVLTLDGMSGDTCVYRLIRSFAVCPSNVEKRKLWKESGFWVGQCSFPGWMGARLDDGRLTAPAGLTVDESRDLDAELVARMGVQVARINLAVERRDDNGYKLDFDLTEKSVKAFASKGLELDLQFFMAYGAGAGPIKDQYAGVPVEQAALYPVREIPYRHYVNEIAKRYGKYAIFFQVGNEPGNEYQYKGTADDFIETSVQTIDEVRKTWPKIPITNGGYCNTGDTMKAIVRGLNGKMDFVSYHWHGDFTGLKSWFAGMQQIHKEAGYADPKFANTEMGFYMTKVGGERINAVYEIQKLIYCWAHEHIGVLLYSSREIFWPRQYLAKNGADYGFVDYFFCPRFVYGATSAFLDRYAGYKFERVIKESDNVHAYEFRRGKTRMVAFFAVNGPTPIKIQTDAKSISLIDPMGNQTKIKTSHEVNVNAGEYPQTLVFSGAEKIELL